MKHNINHVLKHTANTLKALAISAKSNGWNNWKVIEIDKNKSIKLPNNNNIEYLRIFKLAINLDMSECKRLIAVTLSCVDGKMIIWPKGKDIEIPLVHLGDTNNDTYWKNMVKQKKINAKFVILKQLRNHRTSQFRGPSESMLLNDDEDIKRISIDGKGYDDKDKCLVLEKGDINDDLLEKILRFASQGSYSKNMREIICDKWMIPSIGKWIYQF